MELTFNSDTKHRKDWFTGISFSHPAKMMLPLQMWIIDNYTQPGDVILDPMAGSGTIMAACSLGRNVICVELEDKFCTMMAGNWQKIQQRGPQMGYSMGTAEIIQGDARNLEGLLVDRIITSPPYAENTHHSDDNSTLQDLQPGRQARLAGTAGDSGGNVGQLPYGKLDAVITSPPYEHVTSGPSRSPFWDRLANDPTSARYGRQKHPSVGEGYHQVDSIITSPPYDEGGGHGGNPTKCALEKQQSSMGQGTEHLYGKTDGNIGNLKSTSYLEAMLQVYSQCFKVLRPEGLMILVVKSFIRDKKIVPLDEDTKKLCIQAGFSFVEEHYRLLTAQSFWRVIYAQRYPDAPKIDKENILVFKKT